MQSLKKKKIQHKDSKYSLYDLFIIRNTIDTSGFRNGAEMKLFTSVVAKLTQDLQDILCQNTNGCLSENSMIQDVVSKTGLMLLQSGNVWELVGSIQSVYRAHQALAKLLDVEFHIEVEKLILEDTVEFLSLSYDGEKQRETGGSPTHFGNPHGNNEDQSKDINYLKSRKKTQVPDPVVLSINLNEYERGFRKDIAQHVHQNDQFRSMATNVSCNTEPANLQKQFDENLISESKDESQNSNRSLKKNKSCQGHISNKSRKTKTLHRKKIVFPKEGTKKCKDFVSVAKRSKKAKKFKDEMNTCEDNFNDSALQMVNSDEKSDCEQEYNSTEDSDGMVIKKFKRQECDSDNVHAKLDQPGDNSEEDHKSTNQSKLPSLTVTSISMKNKCDLCDYVGKHSRDLGQHKMEKHLDNVLEVEEYSNLGELDVTKSDNMLYKKVEEQGLKHIDPKAKNIPCQVKDCVFVAKMKHNMIEHYARMHSVRNLKCKFCETLFSLYRDLKRHLKHHNIHFACEKCGKMYRSLRTFTVHQKTHEDDFVKPEYECTTCGKKFSTKYVLRYHVKSEHMGLKKSFICPTCGKSFTQKQSYIMHANVHLGIRPFVCEVCGFSFPYEKSLREHKYMHEDGKHFKCEICGKQFKQPSALGTHMKIHKETKDHLCKICGKGFTQKQALLRHERVHSGDKPFTCTICSKNFNDASIIRRHMIMVHKINSKDWRSFTLNNTPRQTEHFIRVLSGEQQPQLQEKGRPPKHLDPPGDNCVSNPETISPQASVPSIDHVDLRAHAALALSSMASNCTPPPRSDAIKSPGSETLNQSVMMLDRITNTTLNSQSVVATPHPTSAPSVSQGTGECSLYQNYLTSLPSTNYSPVQSKSDEAGIGDQLNAMYTVPVRSAMSEPLLYQYMNLTNYNQYS